MLFIGTFAALALAGSVSAGPCKPKSSSLLSATITSASATSSSTHGSGPIINEIAGGDFRSRSNTPSGISNFIVDGQGNHVEGGGYTGGGSSEKNCAGLEAASTQPGPGKRDVGQYASISQQLTNLQPGTAYTVQFFYAVQSSAQSGACRIEASFGSNVFTSTPYFTSSNSPSPWASSTVSTNIQVTQGQMSFALTCTSGGSAQVYIDSIFVSNQVTPENINDADLVFDGAAGTESTQLPSATDTEAATEATTEATIDATTDAATDATTEAATEATSDAANSGSVTETIAETNTEEGNTSETDAVSGTTSEEQNTSVTETATETVSGEEGTSVAGTVTENTVEEGTSVAATSTEISAEEEGGSTTEAGTEETTTAQEETSFSVTAAETSTEVEETTSETLTPTSTTPTSTQRICPSGVSAPGGCYVPDEVPGTPTCFEVGFVSGVVDVHYQYMHTPVNDWHICASACSESPGCLSFGYDAEDPTDVYCALYASKLDWSFSKMNRGLTWTEMDCIKCVECGEDANTSAPFPTETAVAADA
ncbi:hypothetical protein ACHAPT_009067 [Fusarium lateritium]